MYFIQFEVRPRLDSDQFSAVGGAVANCFIDVESEADARKLAAQNFLENGWEIVSVDDGPMVVDRNDYLEEPEWLEWFDQAATDGECYVFHQWPPEAQEDDCIH